MTSSLQSPQFSAQSPKGHSGSPKPGCEAEKLSVFIGALEEWGCGDHFDIANHIIEFQRSGYDLSEYMETEEQNHLPVKITHYTEDLANEVFSAINWKEVPLADYNDAVELIRKAIFSEMQKSFCVGWERGNSVYGGHDPDIEFLEWVEEIGKGPALLPKDSLTTGLNGWQTIDTAPKDGTKIDLWVLIRPSKRGEPERYERFPASWWDADRNDWKLGRLAFTSKFYADAHIPTHWRLPPPAPEVLA